MSSPAQNSTAVVCEQNSSLRSQIIRALSDHAYCLRVLAECGSPQSLRAALQLSRPDTLIVDIAMLGAADLSLLEQCRSAGTRLIFTAESDRHVALAFKHQALDYILKPFTEERIQSALRLLGDSSPHPESQAKTKPAASLTDCNHRRLSRFVVRDGERINYVSAADVDWIESSGNYVILHVGKNRYMLRGTLTSLEAQLPASEFFRLNRSALSRLDRIQTVETSVSRSHAVRLTNGTRLVLTRNVGELSARMKFA